MACLREMLRRASGRHCRDGRRHGKIRRLARHVTNTAIDDGWLERVVRAFERNPSGCDVARPANIVAKHAPLGRADLPTASYTEMMEWALPTRTRDALQRAVKEFGSRPMCCRFLRGGPWRGFFRKYSESNLLHKKCCGFPASFAAEPRRRSGRKPRKNSMQARDLCCARSATMPTGTEFSAGSMRRICAPTFCAI